MTQDIIVLTPKMPDPAALLAALHAGGPDLTLTTTDDDAVIHLCTTAGRPLVSVEAPVLVHTVGEAERLLGPQLAAPEPPFWWTELRASSAVPEAEPLAASVAARLTMLLGGTTWPRSTNATAVVDTAQTQPADITPTPAAAGALPIVDALTDSTAVVIADRPVLALTTWLADVLRITTAANRALHIVTPPHVRLTLPLRTALGGAPNRWVIQHPEALLLRRPVRRPTRMARRHVHTDRRRKARHRLHDRHRAHRRAPTHGVLPHGPRTGRRPDARHLTGDGLAPPGGHTTGRMGYRRTHQPPLVDPPVDRSGPRPRP